MSVLVVHRVPAVAPPVCSARAGGSSGGRAPSFSQKGRRRSGAGAAGAVPAAAEAVPGEERAGGRSAASWPGARQPSASARPAER